MSGLFVDFDLGMVRSHMTLTASAREPRDSYGARVTRMTSSAISNRAVILRFTYGVTLRATAANSGRALQLSECVSRPLDVARMIALSEIGLFRRETFFTKDGGPGRGCMAATEKLLIDPFVTGAAIAGRDRRRYDKSIVLFLLLILLRLMAVQARNPRRGVLTQLVFMDNGILLVGVALRAFPCRFDEVCGGLIDLDARSRPMQEESAQNESKRNSNGDKNRTERHASSSSHDVGNLRRQDVGVVAKCLA